MNRSALWGGFCTSDSNICGTASRSSPCRRMSATTPTTVYQGRSDSRAPSLNLLPTESRPGHRRRAIASLMIATDGASGPSPIEKKRPLSNGVPRVLKKSALTSSLVNSRRSETVPASRSTVRACSLGLPMNRSPMPALSTPGTA